MLGPPLTASIVTPTKVLPTIFVLCLCVALAGLLRGYCAAGSELSADELFSWRLAHYPAPELVRRTGKDVHPPLYYLLLRTWASFLGDSSTALRGLSVLFGALCVPFAYVVVLEVWAVVGGADRNASTRGRGGALIAAVIMAVHTTQVSPGCTARMYSVGVFLCGLSTWLLLRALRSKECSLPWWLAYGFALAAFCYTHYYAFFSILFQVVWVVLYSFRLGWSPSHRGLFPDLRGCGFAAVVAGILLIPWMPVLHEQVNGVRASYWIRPPTWQSLSDSFCSWSTGLENLGERTLILCPLLLIGAAVWALARGPQPAFFFLLQAIGPWLLSIALSTLGNRPIFVERYLVFAHFFFIGLWGILWNLTTTLPERLLLAFFLLIVLLGAGEYMLRTPGAPPPIAAAARHLKEKHEGGDVVLVSSPPDVNRILYYTGRVGLHGARVQCRISPSEQDSRSSHIASLTPANVGWGEVATKGVSRVWIGQADRVTPPAPTGMILLEKRTFGEAGAFYTLALYGLPDSTTD